MKQLMMDSITRTVTIPALLLVVLLHQERTTTTVALHCWIVLVVDSIVVKMHTAGLLHPHQILQERGEE
jgi:hypothetical protein